jgi:ribosomal protein L24
MGRHATTAAVTAKFLPPRDALLGSLIVICKNPHGDDEDDDDDEDIPNATTATTATATTTRRDENPADSSKSNSSDEHSSDGSSTVTGINRYERQESLQRAPAVSRWLHPAFRRHQQKAAAVAEEKQRRQQKQTVPPPPPPPTKPQRVSSLTSSISSSWLPQQRKQETADAPSFRVDDRVEVRHGPDRGAHGTVMNVSTHLVQVCLDRDNALDDPLIHDDLPGSPSLSRRCCYYTPERLRRVATAAAANVDRPTDRDDFDKDDIVEVAAVDTLSSTELKNRIQELLEELTAENPPPVRTIVFEPKATACRHDDNNDNSAASERKKQDTSDGNDDWCNYHHRQPPPHGIHRPNGYGGGGSHPIKTAGTTKYDDEGDSDGDDRYTLDHNSGGNPPAQKPIMSPPLATRTTNNSKIMTKTKQIKKKESPKRKQQRQQSTPVVAVTKEFDIINLVDSSEHHSALMSPTAAVHKSNRDAVFRNVSTSTSSRQQRQCPPQQHRTPIAAQLRNTLRQYASSTMSSSAATSSSSATPSSPSLLPTPHPQQQQQQRVLHVGDTVDISAGIYKGQTGRIVKVTKAGRTVLAHVRILVRPPELGGNNNDYLASTMVLPPQLLACDILVVRPDPPIGLNVLWK